MNVYFFSRDFDCNVLFKQDLKDVFFNQKKANTNHKLQ